MDKQSRPRGLFLVPTDYESLQKKGVSWMLDGRDENGCLERVITVHPTASQERVIDLSPFHRLYEFKERFLPHCESFRILRYPHHVYHLARLWHQLRGIIRQERIDFIRAMDPTFTGVLAWVLAQEAKKPFCISLHADYDKRFELEGGRVGSTLLGSRALARQVEHFVLSRATAVMPIRDSLAEKAVTSGIASERIRVIPHGIDLEPFRKPATGELRQKLAIAPETLLMSFVGRLSRDNYLYDVTHLAQALQEKHLDFQIVIVGDGPERQRLERVIRDHQLGAHVKVLGFQPRDFVIELRKESNVSLCLMGGFSLIEACAAGRPVVSYDVEWHSELVKTDVTGWLVPEKNFNLLRDAVLFLLTNPTEATRMGAAAQALAFERHDIQKTSALKCRYYQELVPEKTPAVKP